MLYPDNQYSWDFRRYYTGDSIIPDMDNPIEEPVLESRIPRPSSPLRQPSRK